MKDPIPYALLPDQLLPESDEQRVHFVPYASGEAVIKGKSSLKTHMISLITEGEKIIHIAGRVVHVAPIHILLLAAGNYLYTERFNKNEQVKSTIIFFDDNVLQNMISQVSPGTGKTSPGASSPFALFAKDDYIHSFIQSIQLLTNGGLLTPPLQQAKLSELLLYLGSRFPEELSNFQHIAHQRPDEERIKKVMEENLLHDLSMNELAFLCHMSLPTFKRKFQQIYDESPAKWVQARRLAIAADLLRRKGARPGDVYLQAGYENHSSFSKAFKQQYGVLPKDY